MVTMRSKKFPLSPWSIATVLPDEGMDYGKSLPEGLLWCIPLFSIHCSCLIYRGQEFDTKLTVDLGCLKQFLLVGKMMALITGVFSGVCSSTWKGEDSTGLSDKLVIFKNPECGLCLTT